MNEKLVERPWPVLGNTIGTSRFVGQEGLNCRGGRFELVEKNLKIPWKNK